MDNRAYGFGSVGPGRRIGGPVGPPGGRRGRRPGPGSTYLPSPYGTPPLARQTWGLGLGPVPPSASSTCSGSSSWLLWRDPAGTDIKPRARRRGRLCSALLAAAVLLVVIAVLAVASLAVYMGALRIDAVHDARNAALVLEGRLRALGDERYETILIDNSSLPFRRTAARYAGMVREVMESTSALAPALLRVDVHRFAAGSLLVFFRLTLDRRKLAATTASAAAGGAGAATVAPNVEAAAAALAAEEALRREATALRPKVFRRVPLDPNAIYVGRSPLDDIAPLVTTEDTSNDSVELRNGVLRKTTRRPTVSLNADSPVTVFAGAVAPIPEPAGSFTITKSEVTLTERRGGTRKEGRPRKPSDVTTTTVVPTTTTPTTTTDRTTSMMPEEPSLDLRPPPPPPPPPPEPAAHTSPPAEPAPSAGVYTTGATFYGGGASDSASLHTSSYFDRYPLPYIPSSAPPVDEEPWRPILPSAGASGEAEVVALPDDEDPQILESLSAPPSLVRRPPLSPSDNPHLPLLQHFPRLSMHQQEHPQMSGAPVTPAEVVVRGIASVEAMNTELLPSPAPSSSPASPLVTLLPARSYLGGPLRRRPPSLITAEIQLKVTNKHAPSSQEAMEVTEPTTIITAPPKNAWKDHTLTTTTTTTTTSASSADLTEDDHTQMPTNVVTTKVKAPTITTTEQTTYADDSTMMETTPPIDMTETTPEDDDLTQDSATEPSTILETVTQTSLIDETTQQIYETTPQTYESTISADLEEETIIGYADDITVITERSWQSVPLVSARRRQPKMALPTDIQDGVDETNYDESDMEDVTQQDGDEATNTVPGVEVNVNFSVSRVSAAREDSGRTDKGSESNEAALAEHIRVLNAVSKLANVQTSNSQARPPLRGDSKTKINTTVVRPPAQIHTGEVKYTKVNIVTHQITEFVPLSSSSGPTPSSWSSSSSGTKGSQTKVNSTNAKVNLTITKDVSASETNSNHSESSGNVSSGSSASTNSGDISGSGLPLFPLLTKIYHKVENPVSTRPSAEEQRAQVAANNTTGCPPERSFRCGDGECISQRSRCNQLVDCADGADERGCACADYLRAQFLTRKLCDGVVDCWDYSDENQCEWCSPGQFVCPNSQVCVSPARLCDGARDCPYGDDERQCVTVAETTENAGDFPYHSEGFLMVRQSGQWGKLCLHNFEKMVASSRASWQVSDLGRAVCKAMTYNDFDRVDRATDEPSSGRGGGDLYFELAIADSSSNATEGPSPRLPRRSSLEFRSSLCPEREVVRVSCKDLECGVRPQAVHQWARSRGSRIVGGGNAGPGAWPWQAALYKEGEFQCGATLISNRWLVSAGHCFYHSQDDYWVARLGALRRGTALPSPYEQQRPIARVLLHPGYVDAGFVNDISLLRMREPVAFSDFVRPICLPPPGTELRDGRLCTVVGWGQLFEVGRIFPDTLQEVALPVISTAECRKRTLFLPLYRVTENMFCAGYDRGGRDACLGDSGGPLMCQEPDGRWSLHGVTSNGYGCARANRPGVYTKVANYVPWIRAALAGEKGMGSGRPDTCRGHRCPLGECLPPSRVCNGFMECSDGSDERGCWGRGSP